METKICTKCGR